MKQKEFSKLKKIRKIKILTKLFDLTPRLVGEDIVPALTANKSLNKTFLIKFEFWTKHLLKKSELVNGHV
jgi:hypothetical protein